MFGGFYTVRFQVNEAVGRSVMYAHAGRMLGGNSAFAHIGTYEERDGGQNLSEFPTSLASRGLVGLGVFLFDPEMQDDVTYRCEGLSEWGGQAAWEVRFEQKRDVESRLMTWRNNRGVYPVALKGRAWISSSTYDVVHLETDLRLTRDGQIVLFPDPSLERTTDGIGEVSAYTLEQLRRDPHILGWLSWLSSQQPPLVKATL